MNAKSLVIISFFFLTAMSAVFAIRYTKVKNIAKKPFIDQNLDITVTPPSESRTGRLEKITGDVKLQPYFSASYAKASPSAKIVQGDSLLTGSGSSAQAVFDKYADISLGQDSEMVISNTIAGQFLFWQKSGNITYTNQDTTKPLSVRSLGVLVSFDGRVRIAADSYYGTVTISDIKGAATAGFEDKENNTITEKLEAGQSAVYNDNSQSIVTR